VTRSAVFRAIITSSSVGTTQALRRLPGTLASQDFRALVMGPSRAMSVMVTTGPSTPFKIFPLVNPLTVFLR